MTLLRDFKSAAKSPQSSLSSVTMFQLSWAGIVWVNSMQPCYVESPWGGYKQSGHGREMSLHGQEEFLETKQVHINLGEAPLAWY